MTTPEKAETEASRQMQIAGRRLNGTQKRYLDLRCAGYTPSDAAKATLPDQSAAARARAMQRWEANRYIRWQVAQAETARAEGMQHDAAALRGWLVRRLVFLGEHASQDRDKLAALRMVGELAEVRAFDAPRHDLDSAGKGSAADRREALFKRIRALAGAIDVTPIASPSQGGSVAAAPGDDAAGDGGGAASEEEAPAREGGGG